MSAKNGAENNPLNNEVLWLFLAALLGAGGLLASGIMTGQPLLMAGAALVLALAVVALMRARTLFDKLIGDKTEVEAMFRQLITDGENRLNPAKDGRHITTTVEEEHAGRLFRLEHELSRKGLRVSSYYMQGLGHLGVGDKDNARAFFTKAIEADPLSIDPKLMLEEVE